jgi:hypothetical protein
MNHIPDITHPIQRDGRSQAQRLAKALPPPANLTEAQANGSALVDEQSLADFLDFTLRYSRQVRFEYPEAIAEENRNGHSVNRTNGQDDKWRVRQTDWGALFRQNHLFVIAAICKTGTKSIGEQFEKYKEDAARFDDYAGVHLLLDLANQVLFQIHYWGVALSNDAGAPEASLNGKSNGTLPAQIKVPFQSFGKVIQDMVRTNLTVVAGQLLVHNKAAINTLAYQPSHRFGELLRLDAWKLGDIINRPNTAAQNAALTGGMGSHRTRVKTAADQIERIFGELLTGMQDIVNRAEQALQDTIKSSHAHPPHVGLLLSFFRLLEKARNNKEDETGSYLNASTREHLDFFYKRVLWQELRPAVPDQVHLVFELAKHLTDTKLDKATAYLGGKDANGRPIVFNLDDEIVVTKAQVAKLRTLYLKGSESTNYKGSLTDVFAAPEANSADGLGEAFPKDLLPPSWKTLGWHESKMPDEAGSSLLAKRRLPQPKARLGLLVSSKLFHLESGKRKVTFTMDCDWLGDAPEEVKSDFTTRFAAIQDAFNTRYEITQELVDSLKKEGLTVIEQFLGSKVNSLLYSPAEYQGILVDIDRLPGSVTAQKEVARSLIDRLVKRHHAFDVSLSGEKEWLLPHGVVMNCTSQSGHVCRVTITIELDPDFPAVTWYDPEAHGEKLDSVLPALRLILRQTQKVSGEVSLYHFFRYLCACNVSVNTEVEGFSHFLLQTEDGVQDARKAFTAFGAAPKIGSSFFIGSSEIFGKRWDDLTLRIGWKDKPDPFKNYYYNYEELGIEETAYKVKAFVLSKQIFTAIEPAQGADDKLFSGGAASVWKFKNGAANSTNEDPAPLEPLTVFTKDRFAKFSLQGETFRHDSFPQVFSLQAQAQAFLKLTIPQLVDGAIYFNTISKTYKRHLVTDPLTYPPRDVIVELPNAPYTPVIESFSINYTAHSTPGDFRFYHLHPFEGDFQKQAFFDANLPVPILPYFPEEGALFLGFSDLVPGDNLDLLFQVAESTADPDLDPADVKWFYLAGNAWKPLEKDTGVLSDDTKGLLRSGVVKIAVPRSIDHNNTILPPGLHWLKVSAVSRANAVSETIAVHTQAAKATFTLEENSDTARLAAPLEDGTVTKPALENAAVKKISQPYPSFNGLPKEADKDFYRRVSEHLRHKGRAINLYDYERLVLEHFPEIYKVKCITHTLGLPQAARDFHLAPGHVTVAVIPNLSKLSLADRLQPKATRSLLDEIEAFLKKRTTPFAKVRVLNPRYQPFRVQGKVRFRQGKSGAFYEKQLQKDLERFLAPWAFDKAMELDFGGVVYKSVILKFIEKLDYVDYVTDFLLLRKKEIAGEPEAVREPEVLYVGGHYIPVTEIESWLVRDTQPVVARARPLLEDYFAVDEIPADTARSILVGEEHVFEILEDDCCKPGGNKQEACMTGLGYTPIGTKCGNEKEPADFDFSKDPDCKPKKNDPLTQQ